MNFIFMQTEHIIIRQWEIKDVTALWKIMSDSRVHRFTGDTPWTMERTAEYIQYMLDLNFISLESFHGACILKNGGGLIGLTGLNPYLPKQPEIEWQLGVPFWGKGFATEIGQAVILSSFGTTKIDAIYGMANPLNSASMRVLEKIGMTCLGLQDFRGEQAMFYRIERSSLPQ